MSDLLRLEIVAVINLFYVTSDLWVMSLNILCGLSHTFSLSLLRLVCIFTCTWYTLKRGGDDMISIKWSCKNWCQNIDTHSLFKSFSYIHSTWKWSFKWSEINWIKFYLFFEDFYHLSYEEIIYFFIIYFSS